MMMMVNKQTTSSHREWSFYLDAVLLLLLEEPLQLLHQVPLLLLLHHDLLHLGEEPLLLLLRVEVLQVELHLLSHNLVEGLFSTFFFNNILRPNCLFVARLPGQLLINDCWRQLNDRLSPKVVVKVLNFRAAFGLQILYRRL